MAKLFSIKTFGYSMMPILRNGDVVSVEAIPYSKIKVDDIICFRQKNRFVTHRVVYKAAEYIIAKGDNNPFCDGKIKQDKIIGKARLIRRGSDEFNVDNFYLLQSSVYFDEIKRIIRVLKKGGVNFVVLKGLPLYLYLTGEHPRRIYADCDILIAGRHSNKADKILVENGYQAQDSSNSFLHKKIRGKVSEVSYLKTVHNFPVIFDVHYDINFLIPSLGKLNFLYPQSKINLISSVFLQNKKEINVGGQSIPFLSPDNLFIFLILHLTHHAYCGYNRYELLSSLVKAGEIKADLILSIVKRYELANFFYLPLLLLKESYPNKIYELMLDQISMLIPGRVEGYSLRTKEKTVIFNDEARVATGVRFKRFFILSPRPFLVRILSFIQPNVIYAILRTLIIFMRFIVYRFFSPKISNRSLQNRLFADTQ